MPTRADRKALREHNLYSGNVEKDSKPQKARTTRRRKPAAAKAAAPASKEDDATGRAAA